MAAEKPKTDPALEFMVRGFPEDEKKLLYDAYYLYGRGDPHGFAATFAIILRAHAEMMRRAPYRTWRYFEERFEPKTKVLTDDLTAELKTWKETLGKTASETLAANQKIDTEIDAVQKLLQSIKSDRGRDLEFLEKKIDQFEGAAESVNGQVAGLKALLGIYAIAAGALGFSLGCITVFLFDIMRH
jgi:chaperonin cofactor prefoldin